MSADEMIERLGSCRTRSEIAAMIEVLSQHPWLNTPVEGKRLVANPRGDGEPEGLQPRLPSPAQRAPPAPRPPLTRIEEQRASRLAHRQAQQRLPVQAFPVGGSRAGYSRRR
jgi:hypothetical protein